MKAVFPFLLMAAFLLALWYIARRTAWALGMRPMICYIAFGLVFLFAVVFTIMASRAEATQPILHAGAFVASYILGLLFCMLWVFLLVDMLHLLFHFSARLWGMIAGGITLVLVVFGMGVFMQPKVREVKIPIEGLQRNTRMVHLTDLHLGQMRGKRNLQAIVKKTNAQNPDMVVITGDIYDSYYNLSEETLRPLQDIKVPLYFVEGNHDIYIDSPRIKGLLRGLGVKVLENEVVIEKGIQLIGLDYLRADNKSFDNMNTPYRKETIQNVLASLPIDKNLPTVALHHNPIGAEYFAKAGADLYLAGHTHGGQFYPLIWINDKTFEYNRGLYQHKAMHIYVSPGTGATAIPLRLGQRAEITVIDLVPQSGDLNP